MLKLSTAVIITLSLFMASCTPTVQVAVPNEPITINLNVRIEHEIRVKVEQELDGILPPTAVSSSQESQKKNSDSRTLIRKKATLK